MLPFRKILCPTDFSESSYAAAHAAVELAEHFGSELWFIHAVAPAPIAAVGLEPIAMDLILTDLEREESAKKSLAEIAARFESMGLKTRFTVLRGDPAEEILRTAGEGHADLIVTSTHGHTGLTHLIFGSVAEKIVRLSPCPVLAIRANPVEISSKHEATTGSVGHEVPSGQETNQEHQVSAGSGPAYFEELEGRLKDWEAAIDHLTETMEVPKTGSKVNHSRQIEELRLSQQAAHKRLVEMREAGETAWEDLKSIMERNMVELKEAYEKTLLKLSDAKEKAQGKIVKKKKVYAEKAEAELREWGATVELLKAKANRSKAEAKLRYMEEIERLQVMQTAATERLQELRGSGDEAWTDLKGGLDRALGELKQGVKDALSHFKETQ